MKDITVRMIKDMQRCIDFEKTLKTNHNHKILRVRQNTFVDYIDNKNWNYLIELGLADRSLGGEGEDLVLFYLTDKGLKFLANLCGFKDILKMH